MGKYIAKRIGYMALVFLIVSFLMYSLYNLIPTDPARAELEAQKQSLKPAEYEQLYQELRAKMGLDDPLVIRYMRWMGPGRTLGTTPVSTACFRATSAIPSSIRRT